MSSNDSPEGSPSRGAREEQDECRTSSRKRRKSEAGPCRLVHAVTGERCMLQSFHSGPHTFDRLDVSADISAWHRGWPAALTLSVDGGDGAVDELRPLLGIYRQTHDILMRRPVYESETGSAVLCFDRQNAWVVRLPFGLQPIVLQLKDACRTPDCTKKKWQRVHEDGRLEDVPGVRCVRGAQHAGGAQEDAAALEQEMAAAVAAAAAAEEEELLLAAVAVDEGGAGPADDDAAAAAAAAQDVAAFLPPDDDDDDWMVASIQASAQPL